MNINQFPANDIEQRLQGLGGSDAGAALGINPWKSPVELWLEKTGRAESPDLTDNEKVQMGIFLEEPIAQLYANATNQKIRNSHKTYWHPEHGFMYGHIDRLVSPFSQKWGVEIKNSGSFMRKQYGEPFSDEIPLHYEVQAHHYISILGLAGMDIAVLFGGQELVIFRILRDEKILEKIHEKEKQFWQQHVLKDTKPEILSEKDLELLFPNHKVDQFLTASEEIQKQIQHYKSLNAEIKGLQDQKSAIALQLKKALAEAEGFVDTEQNVLATYRSSAKTKSRRLYIN